MAEEAKSFGVQATFNRPALNANSLSEIVTSSVATSLSSKTELTSLKTGKLRSVRTDVVREKQNAPDDKFATGEWRVFLAADPERYVMRVWKWSARNEDFAQLIDPRCRFCYKTVASLRYELLHRTSGMMCHKCSACFFCQRCVATYATRQHSTQECSDFAKLRRNGFLVKSSGDLPSYNVAWKKKHSVKEPSDWLTNFDSASRRERKKKNRLSKDLLWWQRNPAL